MYAFDVAKLVMNVIGRFRERYLFDIVLSSNYFLLVVLVDIVYIILYLSHSCSMLPH